MTLCWSYSKFCIIIFIYKYIYIQKTEHKYNIEEIKQIYIQIVVYNI